MENKINELEKKFDRLLVLAVDENEIIDRKLQQIGEVLLKVKQGKKQMEHVAKQSNALQIEAKEVLNLISAEKLNLTEYSDALVYRGIERVTVISKGEIRIRFVSGYKITQQIY